MEFTVYQELEKIDAEPQQAHSEQKGWALFVVRDQIARSNIAVLFNVYLHHMDLYVSYWHDQFRYNITMGDFSLNIVYLVENDAFKCSRKLHVSTSTDE